MCELWMVNFDVNFRVILGNYLIFKQRVQVFSYEVLSFLDNLESFKGLIIFSFRNYIGNIFYLMRF